MEIPTFPPNYPLDMFDRRTGVTHAGKFAARQYILNAQNVSIDRGRRCAAAMMGCTPGANRGDQPGASIAEDSKWKALFRSRCELME